MKAGAQGLIWCFTFVILESIQAVFFGGLFQRMDSFLIGSLIFGLSTLGGVALTLFLNPGQLALAFRNVRPLIGLNVTAALSWIAYLICIQLIEPAVAFTI